MLWVRLGSLNAIEQEKGSEHLRYPTQAELKAQVAKLLK
jgi:hypothetical protein